MTLAVTFVDLSHGRCREQCYICAPNNKLVTVAVCDDDSARQSTSERASSASQCQYSGCSVGRTIAAKRRGQGLCCSVHVHHCVSSHLQLSRQRQLPLLLCFFLCRCILLYVHVCCFSCQYLPSDWLERRLLWWHFCGEEMISTKRRWKRMLVCIYSFVWFVYVTMCFPPALHKMYFLHR